MEVLIRKPYQGVMNILRFNWHFYALAFLLVIILLVGQFVFFKATHPLVLLLIYLFVMSMVMSLAVSYYVYDLSGLYKLDWLKEPIPAGARLINVHAGFDETSPLLANKYPDSVVTALDFYDASQHTEISIKRAREVYTSFPGTIQVTTERLPFSSASLDYAFCFLSAHEIRTREERNKFFKELARCIRADGKIIVVEHLRDWPNFLAYNIGFFHFHSMREWKLSFDNACLLVENEQKVTPFITAFILRRNGISS